MIETPEELAREILGMIIRVHETKGTSVDIALKLPTMLAAYTERVRKDERERICANRDGILKSAYSAGWRRGYIENGVELDCIDEEFYNWRAGMREELLDPDN